MKRNPSQAQVVLNPEKRKSRSGRKGKRVPIIPVHDVEALSEEIATKLGHRDFTVRVVSSKSRITVFSL